MADNRIELYSRQDVERFLSNKPRGWAEILAARAALRVVPLLYRLPPLSTETPHRGAPIDIVLSLLRGAILPWLAVVAPISSMSTATIADAADAAYVARDSAARSIIAAVAHAADAAYAAANAAAWGTAADAVTRNSARNAAADAADAAARAAAAADDVPARAAASAAAALARGPGTVAGDSRDWTAAATAAYAALSHDARCLEGAGLGALTALPLWIAGGVPQPISDAWDAFVYVATGLKDGQDWRLVWLDWYEAVRDGRPAWGLPREVGERILVEAMLWPQKEWDKGASYINPHIRMLIEREPERLTRAGSRNQPTLKTRKRSPKKTAAELGSEAPKPKTKIGTLALENSSELLSLCTGLILLIDQRLSELRESRPNSEDAVSERDRDVAQLEQMRRQIADLTQEIARFKQAATDEGRLVKSTNRFRDGIAAWWARDRDAICGSTARAGLLCLSFGILQTLGVSVSGHVATAAAAIVVGGKPIAEALKSMKSILKG